MEIREAVIMQTAGNLDKAPIKTRPVTTLEKKKKY
jgi:hypothetical protein